MSAQFVLASELVKPRTTPEQKGNLDVPTETHREDLLEGLTCAFNRVRREKIRRTIESLVFCFFAFRSASKDLKLYTPEYASTRFLVISPSG